MSRSVLTSTVIATIVLFYGQAASAVTVLGLPLGEKISPPVRLCPANTDNAKNICWVGWPYLSKDGSRLGTVHLPNPDTRPEWAAYAMFKAYVGQDGVLLELEVSTFGAKDKNEIASSISSRFGLPIESTLSRSDVSWAKWVNKDIYINMACTLEKCWVEFKSPRAQAERDKQAADARARTEKRPISP